MPPKRKSPNGFDWSLISIEENFTRWGYNGILALSGTAFIQDEHLPPHWEWIVSFSKNGRRITDLELVKPLKDFEMELFEEDNHESGIARKFWLAIDHKYRKPCPCKDEKIITEGEYSYSIKK